MIDRVRTFFDKVVYAGLKPSGSGAGENHLDPLYLSNRSPARKILTGGLIALPFVVIAIGVYLAVTGYFSDPVAIPPPVSRQAKAIVDPLPGLKDARVDKVQDIAVLNVRVTRGPGAALDGMLKNATTRQLRFIEVVFDLTDAAGSQLGGVTVRMDKLEAEAIANFHLPIKQQNAFIALMREVRSQ